MLGRYTVVITVADEGDISDVELSVLAHDVRGAKALARRYNDIYWAPRKVLGSFVETGPDETHYQRTQRKLAAGVAR